MNVFDLSEFQPDDRVRVLAEHYNADGFIFKLGETINGTPELDPKCADFINDAKNEGKPFGVYFVSHARAMDDFMTEAHWINDTLFDLLGDTFPELGIWWDMEYSTVCRADVWPQLRDAIGTMEDWYKDMRVGIYAGYSYFYDWLDFDELNEYQIPLWVAQYGYHENSLKAEHPELKHVAWQYSDTTGPLSQDVSEWYGFEG